MVWMLSGFKGLRAWVRRRLWRPVRRIWIAIVLLVVG